MGRVMPPRLVLAALLFLVACVQTPAAENVFISEFMAVNNWTLADEDGDFSDWIEIHNGGTAAVDLNGWFLTDRISQLTEWRFPSTNLPPNGYLAVFASGKDRRVPGAPLHTNFKLSSSGEYLALVKPDGTNVVSAFAPQFPGQVSGVSYGIPLQPTLTTLIASGATARVFVPQDGLLGATWTTVAFDDSGWLSRQTGVGFETDGQGGFAATTIADSVSEFSGSQGQDNWFYGYWDKRNDADGLYADSEFVAFPNNLWTGSSWDWFAGNPPFTQLSSQGGRASGGNGNPALPAHWAIRRYICETNGPITITGTLTHTSDWR